MGLILLPLLALWNLLVNLLRRHLTGRPAPCSFYPANY